MANRQRCRHRQWSTAAAVAVVLSSCTRRYLGSAESLDHRFRRRITERRIPFVEDPVAPAGEESLWFGRRELQTNETNDACSLCRGYTLRENIIPPYEPSEELPEGLTCRDWEEITSTFPLEYFQFSTCEILTSSFGPACCETPPTYVCEQNVRSQIFSTYDAAVAPLVDGKLKVGTQLDFYHITELDLKSATAQIFTWLYLNWTDPRLSWDNSNNASTTIGIDTCAASITVRASLDAELTDIWVPDYDLYNQVNGVQHMPEAMATVYPDGSVLWVRNGGIRALCFFSGLRAFPYDTLGCSFLFGGWTRQGNIEFILGGEDGDGFFAAENVKDIKYTEYKLIPEKTETGHYEGTKNAIYYNFFFERAQRYYVTKIVIPTIIFTILSFGVFLLDPRVGERLTYGLTVLLVIIAQDIVTSERLPIANERLWINVFSNASFYWVLISLLESILIMWLYFLRDNEIEEGRNKSVDNRQGGDDTEENSHDNAESSDQIGCSPNFSIGPGQESLQNPDPDHSTPLKSRAVQTINRALISARMPGAHTPHYHFIRKIDRVCFIVVPSSYIIFVIVMLATKPQQWSEDHDIF